MAGLALGCMAPEVSSTLVIFAGCFGLLMVRGRHLSMLQRPAIWMPLCGGIALALAYSLGSMSLMGIPSVLVFAPLFLIWPLLVLLRSAGSNGPIDPAFPASFALLGVAGAMVIALNDHFVLGLDRAGGSVANPIHFGDIVTAAGFLALVGWFSNCGRWRWLFLLGPVFALVAVLLSGSRGPLLGYLALLIASLGYIVSTSRWAWRGVIFAGLGVAALAVAITFLGLSDQTGALRVFANLGEIIRSGTTSDSSTAERLVMYQAAWAAFQTAPIFGYGLVDFVSKTAAFAVPGTMSSTLPHLHNDIADFAVSGGVVGLMGYVLFLLAPLVEAIMAPAGPNRRAARFAGLSLSLGYFVMGLTNAMFGILMLTVFFAFGAAIVSQLARSD